MKDNLGRIGLITFLVLLAAWAVSDVTRFRLGPDLSGGTILIYQVDQEELKEGGRLDMEELLPTLKRRLDPAGLYNYVIRALGDDRVEIVMPEAQMDDVELIKRRISTVGQLQFYILITRQKERHIDYVEDGEDAWPNKIVGPASEPEALFIKFGQWEPINPRDPGNAEVVSGADAGWPNKAIDDVTRFMPQSEVTVDEANPTPMHVKDEGGKKYVLARWNDDGVEGIDDVRNVVRIDEIGNRYVLVLNDNYQVTGEYLTRAEPTQQQGNIAVAFNFNSEGANKFLGLTTEYQPEADGFKYQLGVVLDNRLRSAPVLNQKISSSGVIEGNFTSKEVNELVNILRSGRLPFALEKTPDSEYQIAPLLGQDTIRKGSISIAVSMAIVIVFISLYYRVAGFVAVFALVCNLLFTIALMVMFKATWTLPGLAGLVLTVGMSVDANVLIFERFREELDRGASIGMAIRNGYEKVFSTIFDSNTTTILTAVILFAIGTDQVKGFAVTLILGILTSMFCALYVTRTIFNILYAQGMRRLSMARILSDPKFDFLSGRNISFVVSAALIVIGLSFAIVRGKNNFDIDFTGGTMVGLHLNQDLDSGTVRKLATEGGVKDVAVEKIELSVGDQSANDSHFVIRTTERDPEGGDQGVQTVKQKVAAAFKEYLDLPKLLFTPPAPVQAASEEAEVEGDESQLSAFEGGQQSKLSFENYRSPGLLIGQLNELLRAKDPDVADPSNLYVLEPTDEGQASRISGESALHKEFVFATTGTAEEVDALLTQLQSAVNSSPEFDQYSQFGAQVVGETQNRAIMAIAISWLSIIVYVGFRFGSWTYGLAGVIALVHDVLISFGMLAAFSFLGATVPALNAVMITDMKVDLNVVAALLTLIGYSINDTIVVFDRIREVKGKTPRLNADIINRSLNATLSRTIITSLTTFMVVAILMFGGAGLRGFAFVLVIGAITGTYSSIFVASPVLLWLSDYQARRKESTSGASAKAASF